MPDNSVFEQILRDRMRTSAIFIWIMVGILALWIILIHFNVIHDFRKNKDGRRDKLLTVLVVAVFLGYFIIAGSVQYFTMRADVKSDGYVYYYGEAEYEKTYRGRHQYDYDVIIYEDGEKIHISSSDDLELKEDEKHLGAFVYSERSRILLHYEIFE